jgi:hypothetical protein
MARRTIRCRANQTRFTLIRVNGDDLDSHAARSFEQALRLAQPDRGAKLDVYAVCATDPAEARFKFWHGGEVAQLLRTMRYKRGG